MKKIILILLCSIGLAANAQVQTLTLKDALLYALENKADAKKSKLEIEKSEYKIQEVRSLALPQISANGGLTYNPVLQTTYIDGSNFNAPGTTIQANFGQKWTSHAGIGLDQAIFDLTVFTGLQAAKSTREFYQINNELTEEQIIERVATSYYAVYVQRERLALLDSTYANTVKVRNIVQGQYNNGIAKKIDLDRIIVRISNINAERQQVQNQIELQENALKFYMGMPMDMQFIIPQSEYEINPAILTDATNTHNRTEYLLLKKQEELLNYKKSAIKAQLYPTLSLFANYNYLGQGPQLPWFAHSSDDVYWSDYSSVGLTMRVPIFTGFGTRSRIKQADADIRLLQEDIKDTELGLDLDYKNAKAQIDNNLVIISNQKENMQLAMEITKNTNNNYLQGLASLTDLLDAQNASLEAQNNYNRAVLNYKIAEVALIKSRAELKTLIK
ncbi:MAG TPA: TolC family protein [Flavobacterium sp.]|uniref:TolC family protein n=1 Tax=Flavobacterium sp. TaxID=239 RepID=UPI002C3B6E82|nr:TolC family protein [Flavobacterium sp.]HSD15443.1 TolC family protein [Flavobacterium sp.]